MKLFFNANSISEERPKVVGICDTFVIISEQCFRSFSASRILAKMLFSF